MGASARTMDANGGLQSSTNGAGAAKKQNGSTPTSGLSQKELGLIEELRATVASHAVRISSPV